MEEGADMFGLTPLGNYIANSLLQNILTGLFNNLAVQPVQQTIQINNNIMNTEIKETPDAYILQAVLPGVSKESISVKYIDNYLTLTANGDQYMQNNYGGYTRCISNISRSFYFNNIDGEKVDGSFENGVLKLILPKIKNTDSSQI